MALSPQLKRKTPGTILLLEVLKCDTTFNGGQRDSGDSLPSSSLIQVPHSPPSPFHLAEPGQIWKSNTGQGKATWLYGAGPPLQSSLSSVSWSRTAWSNTQAWAHCSALKALNKRVASFPWLCRQILQWGRCQTQPAASPLKTVQGFCTQHCYLICSSLSCGCHSIPWIWC